MSAWPTVAFTELDDLSRADIRDTSNGPMLRYTAGESVKAIERSTGINRRQLYRWLERAQTPHSDGRPYGFRALIHYLRIADYERVRDVQREASTAAGARQAH
ncbi:hypothetical protein BZM27_52365 [Paraburkholderia steynii]|uniref:Uncharacterized protein n=1 Tax=Paraburkholderia steynii TaxID=1245441 RepID=A0A4R0X669_9BURK|nr:hypothetical protein BZM27_52365 [Paraburkholderia steynii]